MILVEYAALVAKACPACCPDNQGLSYKHRRCQLNMPTISVVIIIAKTQALYRKGTPFPRPLGSELRYVESVIVFTILL